MYVVSCPCYRSIAESRTFWERWQTLCLVRFLAGLGWLVHVHGSWVALRALWHVGWTLLWLQVKSSAWGDAGKMNVHRTDLITSSPATAFIRTPVSAPQPAATIFQLPLQHSSGGAAPPAWIPPCPHLAALSSSQAVSRPGAGTPHGGQVEPRALGGTLRLLLAFGCAMGSPGGHRVNAGADRRSLWVSPLPGA